MVRTRSTLIRPRSYTLLRKCCTRRAQACYLFANIVLFLLLVGLGIGLAFVLVAQLEIIKAAEDREAKIFKFENTTFMPYCEYFVSPWFLNLCNIQDIYIARAWRVYRLFPGQHHSCMNVQEETKCSESDIELLPDDGSYKMIKFCRSINDEYVDEEILQNLNEFYERQKYPRRPLTNLVGDVVRAVDIIAVCPICFMHETDKVTKDSAYPTHLETIRFGWPVTRSKCETDYQGKRALKTTTTPPTREVVGPGGMGDNPFDFGNLFKPLDSKHISSILDDVFNHTKKTDKSEKVDEKEL